MSSTSKNSMPKVDVTENGMSKEKEKLEKQKKRTRRNQKYNTHLLLISIAILMALSASLVARIYKLNGTIESLTAQINELSREAARQQEEMKQLREALAAGRDERKDGGGETKDGAGAEEDREPAMDGDDRDAPEITAAHKVYLTFDDGPSIYTQDILDILEEYDVKATFFVVGKESESAKESMKKIVEAGHTLGMHSYTHKYSELYASVDNFAEDFARQQEYIYDITGVKSTVYRFPGGSSNTVSKLDMKVFAEYLDSQGVTYYDWNVSSGDGSSAIVPVETLLENCTSTIGRYGTSIVLMHDAAGKKTTVEALPEIIETILAMEDTVILPITGSTKPVQHKSWDFDEQETDEQGTDGSEPEEEDTNRTEREESESDGTETEEEGRRQDE